MRRGWSLMHTLTFLAMGVLLILVFSPIYAGDHSRPSSACINNFRNVAVSLLMYAGDEDEHAPVQNWSTALRPYLRPVYETCPRIAERGLKYGYAFHSAIVGVNTANVGDPKKVITFFETDALGQGVIANLAARNEDRHEGESVVTYVDGHARAIAKGSKP